MNLQNLCDIYSLDSSAFYTNEEVSIDVRLNKSRRMLNKIKIKYNAGEYKKFFYKKHSKILNSIISNFKKDLKRELDKNTSITRSVRKEHLITKNIIAIFDSNLTRALNMSFDKLNLQLIVIRVYYFDIMKSIINNGFLLNGEKYVFFSASSGQIRMKKFVAIKESILNERWNTLSCGLTRKKINDFGGVNTNKYLAYLALCNSATNVWENFDIDRCIVVDDFESTVNSEVDFIDKNFSIIRKFMDVPITQTDGCGIINYGNKNFMVRSSWIKGLLSPFRFHDFIKEHNCNPIVKDIYGDEWHIINDNIQIILTKSQFKMWKYYNNWNEYKVDFKKYNCTFGICNEENKFEDSVFSYQMLQTLTDITEEELQYICKSTRNKIYRLSHDIETMLKVFGASKNNLNKNYFQQCLEIYPELLKDIYVKNTLKDIKNSLEKQAWAGKLDVYGKYTFIIPDLYAFCENLFLGDKNPKGLLDDGEVYCKLFKNCDKLDCLRSPHLFREHGVRKNVVKTKKELSKWFISNGIYTSCHDLISKLLQFDNDGDMALVVGDKRFIEIAERNMRDIVPLYYEMAKAPAMELNNESIYNGMIKAFTEGNIGAPSNEITKVWNSDNIDLDIIKIQCALVNFTIDAAKTLYKPEVTKEIQQKISKYSANKLPHFFIYAKDKLEDKVNCPVDRIVDKIQKYIPKTKLSFQAKTLGNFNYKMLLHNHDADIEQYDYYDMVIDKYKQLIKNVNLYMKQDDNDPEKNNYNYIFRNIKEELLKVCDDVYILVDILVYYLFNKKKSIFKYVFWQCFGDIVLENIKHNMNTDYIYCNKCGKRFFREHFNEHLCKDCRTYQKLSNKIITCIDCGYIFQISGNSKNQNRCTSCYKKYRKEYNKIKQKEIRINKSAVL